MAYNTTLNNKNQVVSIIFRIFDIFNVLYGNKTPTASQFIQIKSSPCYATRRAIILLRYRRKKQIKVC